ncbi:hypothetical protein D3C83_166080 [compost metagenome]
MAMAYTPPAMSISAVESPPGIAAPLLVAAPSARAQMPFTDADAKAGPMALADTSPPISTRASELFEA